MNKSMRVLALAGALLGAYAVSPAVVMFSFHSTGSHTVVANVWDGVDDTFFDDNSSPYAPTKLWYTFGTTVPGGFSATSGNGTLYVDGGTIDFNFNGAVIGGGSGYDALAASVTLWNGTGVLAGQHGTGQISNTIDVTDGTKHRTTFEAALVPEPASMAIVALGVAGLVTRRRRR